MCVALYVGTRPSFFDGEACVDCPVARFVGCDRAGSIFDVQRVMRRRLVDVGEGVRMSEPLEVRWRLEPGHDLHASLSHVGVLAVCSCRDTCVVQLVNLRTNRRVKMEVEHRSLVGFYDDNVVLLTQFERLREAHMDQVFGKPHISTFEEVGTVKDIFPDTDVSTLNEKRMLYYSTLYGKLYKFDVDTRENEHIVFGGMPRSIASLTGISCGVEAVYYDDRDGCAYTLGEDSRRVDVNPPNCDHLTAILPSSSSPRDIGDAVFKYGTRLLRGGKTLDTERLVALSSGCSIVRVYRDVFLALDRSTGSWVLVRIAVA